MSGYIRHHRTAPWDFDNRASSADTATRAEPSFPSSSNRHRTSLQCARGKQEKKNYRLFSVDFSLSKNEWKHETRFFSCYKCTRRSVSLSCASALVLDLLNEWVLTNASFVSCPCVCMLRILEFKSIAINGNKLKIGRWNLTSRFCRERSVWKWNVLF